MTAEKKAREQRLRDRRELKRERKAARKEAAALARDDAGTGPDRPLEHPNPAVSREHDGASTEGR